MRHREGAWQVLLAKTRQILLLRPERLLLCLAVGVIFTSWISVSRLPVPVSHPGFDSSKISKKNVNPTGHGLLSPSVVSFGKKDHNKASQNGTVSVPLSNDICEGYDGVLHIQSGDAGGAAGTVFFIYVVNQLLYADKYNLLPWVHLNNVSKHVYDPQVHSGGNRSSSSTVISFQMLHGMTIDFVSDGYRRIGYGSYPGAPKHLLDDRPLTPHTYQVTGTGVWSNYFQPVSEFDPSIVSTTNCANKPLLRMHYYHLNPSMLLYCPWSVKSWPYGSLAHWLAPKRSTGGLKQWYAPMRQRASAIIQKYIRFQPHIIKKAEALLSTGSGTMGGSTSSSCLAMHIRHSDKGGTNRKKIPLENFLPYAQAYIDGGGKKIVLATDSTDVLDSISKTWPQPITSAIVRQSGDALRSSNRKAVFVLGENNHHRTNTEVLVDILAMSKCQFFVHGFSAVSEAVIYLNLQLHENSVDLEDHPLNNHERMSPNEFQNLVQKTLDDNHFVKP